MSAVDFQLLDDGNIDDSIVKRDFIKIYHQSETNVDNEKSNIKFCFGENHHFRQVGIGYLEFDIKIRKDNNDNFSIAAPGNDIIRLVNNTFFIQISNFK